MTDQRRCETQLQSGMQLPQEMGHLIGAEDLRVIRAEAVRLIVVTAIWIEGPRSIGVQSLIGHMIPIGILRVIVNWTMIVIKCPMIMRAEALVKVKRARHCDRVICLTEIAGLAADAVVVVEVVKE